MKTPTRHSPIGTLIQIAATQNPRASSSVRRWLANARTS